MTAVFSKKIAQHFIMMLCNFDGFRKLPVQFPDYYNKRQLKIILCQNIVKYHTDSFLQ